MNPRLETFVKEVACINENDYGDFMRLANVFLNDLRDQLHHDNRDTDFNNINKKLTEIQTYLQFRPNWDVESTRTKLFKDVSELDNQLQNLHPISVH